MAQSFTLAPRYRLDDESIWLVGIAPSRHYWLNLNGDPQTQVVLPGFIATSAMLWKQVFKQFRSLQPGEKMTIARTAGVLMIHCVSSNCYAIASEINNAPVWHLFDRETLESLLMSAHPDWICAPTDVDLGRQMIERAFAQPAIA
jgi:hypothetical protein